jgi:hypothetical protein
MGKTKYEKTPDYYENLDNSLNLLKEMQNSVCSVCGAIHGPYYNIEKCSKYIRYDSPADMADFGLDFPNEEYVHTHGLAPRKIITLDINQDEIVDGSIVFVKWDYTPDFLNLLPQLNNKLNETNSKITLLTGRGDSYLEMDKVDYILQFPCIKKWFRCNPITYDSRIEFFPIGFGEVERAYAKPELLDMFYENPPTEKINKVYVPYFANTQPARNKLITDFIEKHKDMCVVENDKFDTDNSRENRLDEKSYFKKLSKYKYCLSLCGNGYDVHRNYECLLTSTVPVMQHSPVRDYYDKLGICFEPLENFQGKVEFKDDDKEKVLYNYWYDKIKETI